MLITRLTAPYLTSTEAALCACNAVCLCTLYMMWCCCRFALNFPSGVNKVQPICLHVGLHAAPERPLPVITRNNTLNRWPWLSLNSHKMWIPHPSCFRPWDVKSIPQRLIHAGFISPRLGPLTGRILARVNVARQMEAPHAERWHSVKKHDTHRGGLF